jgi:protein-tyrosine phosphatase
VRVAAVCLGNICRSPIAQSVLTDELRRAGVDATVESAGTAGYHEGDPMDPRAAAALRRAGLDPRGHRARRFTADWFDRFDLVLAMDGSNLADLHRLAAGRPRVPAIRLFRSFDPEAGNELDVVDPYFGSHNDGEFDETVRICRRASRAIAAALRNGASI